MNPVRLFIMKKLLFVAVLGVAGVMSAKTKDLHVVVPKMVKKVSMVKKIKKPADFTCTTFKTSCGWTSAVCGNSFVELLQNAWEADNMICSN